MNKGRVLLGMSGGVDSSVAAALLLEEGYEVIGITMKLFDNSRMGIRSVRGGCCGIDLIDDARTVCSTLDIRHYVLDFTESFKKRVIDNFVDEYSLGRTPNPCVSCNTFIKWGAMIEYSKKLECDYIATGHYSRILIENGNYGLYKAAVKGKDQSYALWGIPYDYLSRTLFPLGALSKKETREIAAKYGFRNAERPDSQEICFIPDNDYSAVIKNYPGVNARAFEPGPILDTEGKTLGEHNGYGNFTIGQRKGLGISAPAPLYVVEIDPKRNSVIVGEDNDLFKSIFVLSDINLFVSRKDIPVKVKAKIRYRHDESPASIEFKKNDAVVTFDDPQRAITPGQSAVIYEGERVLGGGIIEKVTG